MKKTSNKADSGSVELDVSTDAHPQIMLIYLVLGLLLILTYLIKNHHADWLVQKPAFDSPNYVWINNSPTADQGLYFFKKGALKGYRATADVSAIKFDNSGDIVPIPLPGRVGNVFFMPIAINSADQELLSTLPGIGPTLAERIINRIKTTGGFKSLDELLLIDGIGPSKLARIRPYILLN